LLSLELSAQDFTELEESYRISFLEAKDAANYKYSLSSWISFENKNLELSPGEEKSVKVFIDKNRITLGGHYASILAKVKQTESDKKININPVLSSLLFVRASTGREIERGQINSVKPQRSGLGFPAKMVLKFQNEGNVYVVPYGEIDIKNLRGKTVAKGVINEGSLASLPESIRRFEVELSRQDKILLPSFYTVETKLHFGKTNKELVYRDYFFSEGSFSFVVIGLILVVIIIFIYLLRKRKKSNELKTQKSKIKS
jgi:LPXTG-motif cell wall-anchored protein